MKHLLLMAAFCTLTTPLFSQAQPDKIEIQGANRLETFLHPNGEKRLQLTISNLNDTIFKAFFGQNGLVEGRQWRRDSLHKFDNRGNLESRSFGMKDDYTYGYLWVKFDSVIGYHFNGRRKNRSEKIGDMVSDKTYSADGQLESEFLSFNRRLINYRTTRDAQGRQFYAHQTDTFLTRKDTCIRLIDSLFHANGRLKMVRVTESLKNLPHKIWTKKQDYFDINGQFLESIVPPDSLNHIPFKDNLSCLYGFRNEQGDTLIVPKFEQIVAIDPAFFAAYEGNNCFLIRKDGTFIHTLPLSDIGKMEEIGHVDTFERIAFRRLYGDEQRKDRDYLTPYFYIKTNGETSVINRRGEVLIPPQYLPNNYVKSNREVDAFYFNTMSYVGAADYLAFSESKINDKTKYWVHTKEGFLNRKGQDVFGNTYKYVQYAGYSDYFKIAQQIQTSNNQDSACWGLAHGNGQVLLDCRFSDIKNVLLTPFFIATITSKYKNGKSVIKKGLFDVNQKRWILDTLERAVSVVQHVDSTFAHHYSFRTEKPHFFIFQDAKTHKYGLLDGNAQILIPPQYDTLGVADGEAQLFWYRNGTNYHILKLNDKGIKRLDYQYLTPFNFPILGSNSAKDIHFIAKRKNKWGVIRADNEAIAVNFDYDYVGFTSDAFRSRQESEIFLFKHGQAFRFDMFSFPKANSFKRFENNHTSMPELNCPLVDNPERRVFMDTTGKVVIPPQYHVIDLFDGRSGGAETPFALVEDAHKKRKIILLDNARIIDFPFDYRLVAVHPNGKIMLVQNEPLVREATEDGGTITTIKQGKYGVVSTDGQLLMPCENFSVALSDEESNVFFVKKDSSTLKIDRISRVCYDSLNIFDKNWLMYDAGGKLLNPKPFRLPIVFKNGIGVGVQGGEFNLFRRTGKLINDSLDSKNYANIWYDYSSNFYILYKRQGLNSRIKIVDKNGKTRLESGNYDGISSFFGKYALVSLAGKIGLIDTLGKEIIAPQDLQQYNENLVDSLEVGNFNYKNKGLPHPFRHHSDRIELPISFDYDFYYNAKSIHVDSLAISPLLRNHVWNLILESSTEHLIKYINTQKVNRFVIKSYCHNCDYSYYQCDHAKYSIRKLKVSDSFIAFVSNGGTGDFFHAIPTLFQNYYHKNNRWERLNPLDFFKNDSDSKTKFYNQLIIKIRALKDADIDCTNSATLIEQAQSNFMLSDEGINIYFKSDKDKLGNMSDKDKITFSWAELLPFLKKDIRH